MSEKLFHQIHHQRGKHDCGVACLATLLGRSYEEVLVAAAKVSPNVLKKGLYANDLAKIAASLGSELKRNVGQIDLDEKTGILEIKIKNRKHHREHFAFLVNGLVFDPEEQGQIWDAYIYVRHFKAEVQGLTEEVE